MKLNILSDLHLGQGLLEPPRNDADVVVLAGDIARPAQAVAWALGIGKPVLYVPGNHEFYGSSVAGTKASLKQLCAGSLVHILDDDEAVIGGVRFLGSTLWTDFLLFGEHEGRTAAFGQALRFMRDYSRIHLDDGLEQLFTPLDSAALFQRHAGWLARKLATPHPGAHRRRHPPRALGAQHSPALRGLASQRLLCLQRRPSGRRRSGPALDSRPYPRQLRLRPERHPGGLQPARLCPRRRQ
jgi:hypothetical protein